VRFLHKEEKAGEGIADNAWPLRKAALWWKTSTIQWNDWIARRHSSVGGAEKKDSIEEVDVGAVRRRSTLLKLLPVGVASIAAALYYTRSCKSVCFFV
jgi:hypothetical protein